jgi:hypothetical protein
MSRLPVLLILAAAVACISCRADEGKDESIAISLTQWQREDIAAFRERFLAVDRSFSAEARAAAEQRLSRLERQSPRPTEFAVELCRIAALADNAHTQCLPSWVGRSICQRVAAIGTSVAPWCQLQTPRLEVKDFETAAVAFYPFGEHFHVVGVEAQNLDLLGAQLVALEDRPIEDIRAMLRTFSGGTAAFRDLRAAGVLASPPQLWAVGLARHQDSATYEFLSRDGGRLKRTFLVSPTNWQAWHGLPSPDRAAWAFQESNLPFRYVDAPQIDSVVVQLRQVQDDGDHKIEHFLREADARRHQLGRKNVVLDMRFNDGGNLYLLRDFMRQWPSRTEGRFFVLSSRRTFSAAIASIAYLKQAGGDRVSIVGEPVGDRLMFFSDGLPIQLPNSGRFFVPAVVRMDYHGACREYDDCSEAVAQPGRPTAKAALPMLGSTERLPISVSSLQPDIDAPWTIESWLSGSDPMMDAVAAMLGKGAK